ncbi:hypothetical protein [Candidatus Frackibacter sp. WG13]|uniref:hypothetical protein n=1 Tax=Candidatus Frackibacter sp. WG13 TaxID=2017978 RepID=UPI000796280A|nr:hypothetical protein [Candidatus Frackibacter sp. WG13]KXS36950.1 MAG: hypothetical protein AWU54_2360 [Candidatus Frackibacter sp. T328-2]SFL86531.1 hypothetical protein SAMN04488699_11732 [Candidatus Frackibacter sp. WG13]
MVDKKVNHDPEREMGSPPPQSMPALFGWMTIDYQSERAKELVEISKSLSPAKGKDTDS